MKRHVYIEKDCIQTVTSNLKVAQNQLKQVKRNFVNHREDYLRQQDEGYELLGNIKLSRHLRNLITIEQKKGTLTHQQIHKQISPAISNT